MSKPVSAASRPYIAVQEELVRAINKKLCYSQTPQPLLIRLRSQLLKEQSYTTAPTLAFVTAQKLLEKE